MGPNPAEPGSRACNDTNDDKPGTFLTIDRYPQIFQCDFCRKDRASNFPCQSRCGLPVCGVSDHCRLPGRPARIGAGGAVSVPHARNPQTVARTRLRVEGRFDVALSRHLPTHALRGPGRPNAHPLEPFPPPAGRSYPELPRISTAREKRWRGRVKTIVQHCDQLCYPLGDLTET